MLENSSPVSPYSSKFSKLMTFVATFHKYILVFHLVTKFRSWVAANDFVPQIVLQSGCFLDANVSTGSAEENSLIHFPHGTLTLLQVFTDFHSASV